MTPEWVVRTIVEPDHPARSTYCALLLAAVTVGARARLVIAGRVRLGVGAAGIVVTVVGAPTLGAGRSKWGRGRVAAVCLGGCQAESEQRCEHQCGDQSCHRVTSFDGVLPHSFPQLARPMPTRKSLV